MAAGPSPFASTKETTNYARLCRLLVDVGSHALRATFDQIHPAAQLHADLAGHRHTLQSLRKKKILNPTQWGKLYPTIPSSVSSAGFDITLLMVLLRNICGLTPPLTGWDSLPSASDMSKEANIARVKYFRNTVYGHASQASVDDTTFNTYWQDISNALVGLGGASYGAIVNDLKHDCMDPDTEEHYKELLTQWKKDEDSIKDKLEEIEELLKRWKGNIEVKLGEMEGNIKDELQQVKNLMAPNKTSRDKEPFNLAECQKQLRDFYNTRDQVKIIPLTQSKTVHIKDIYTTLSWVGDSRKPSGVTEKKLEDYSDIFHGDEHNRNPNRILVSGEPGIGKTTFSKKIALDWSQEMKEILSKFYLVLRIALRDVCNVHDIHGVLKASKLLAGDSEISIDSLYDYISRNPDKVLLILDGYDEYSCTGESPIRDIWEGQLLRDCRIILTTRHGQADEVKGHSQVQFKINGFNSKDQVKAFASKFLKGEEDVQEFVKYLEQKDLMGIAEIPLLFLMLCSIWQKHTEPLTSHADIYTHFIQTLLDHMNEKGADSKQFKDVNDYNEELCKLGKLAFDELLRDSLVIRCSELPDDNFLQKLGEAGLCQILNLSGLNRGKGVYFIHKSIQEFLAAWYLKEELLSRKDENTTCLSKVDSFEKTVKMNEVFKFACELSGEAAFKIVNFLGMIGEKEGLTEYIFAETPSVEVLSNDQTQFLTLISHSFFHCTPEKRQDLYTVFLSYVGGVLLIDSDQLRSVANEHLLKSAEAPTFIFFSSGKHSEQGYRHFISVLEDVNAVVVCCSGEMKAAVLLKKHPFRPVKEFFLKKEEQMKLYIVRIDTDLVSDTILFPIEMLKELISPPKSTQTKKKPVGDQSNEQDNGTALCSTENIDITSGSTRHCLSWLSDIVIFDIERQEMETLIEVLPFVTSPRLIRIFSKYGEFTHDAQLVETLVSRINFTNRLDTLGLSDINLTAKPTAVMARSMTQAPNLRVLDLSDNPLGEGVSDLTRHLSCVPHLELLHLLDVKMTKKQVNDLTAAVRQSNISYFSSSYHDWDGNPKPEQEWPKRWR